MSGLAPRELPPTREKWGDQVKTRKLEGKTVHAAELASGSKIGYDQFLLLRVLWVSHDINASLPGGIKDLLPKAVEMLAGYPSWKTYCDSFGKSQNPEGSFAVARHYQKMAAKTEDNTRPDSFDTPLALRRPKRIVKTLDISKLQLGSPETPSRKVTKAPQTPLISSSDDDSVIDEEEQSPPEVITPAAQVPEDLQKVVFPPTKDEQIVNTALVVFLNALTIHFDVSETCNWTMHRKALVANFEQASFEARTDGYLDDGQENAYALVEVKPVIRGRKQNLIQMQESAQMVAWLKRDAGESIVGELRVHVSQDRHEIFLTFAEYDDDYLAYLRNEKPAERAPDHDTSKKETPENKPTSFLIMHQYGPWNTENPSHMAALGPILLAITLHADAKIRAKQEPTST